MSTPTHRHGRRHQPNRAPRPILPYEGIRHRVQIDVDTPGKSEKVAKSATAGALWGMVFGIVVLTPAMGVVGAAAGGLIGKLSQMGIDDKFRGSVHSLLQPGCAAVVIMASKITDDKFGAAMQQYGGTVLKTSLAEQAEMELAEQLSGTTQ